LENGDTNIYIENKFFRKCNYLLLKQQVEKSDRSKKNRKNNISLSPEVEFHEYCNILHAWVEHNYDTCLLRSNLSFPLLKKLIEIGDPLAKKVIKEEIAKRFTSKHAPTMTFLALGEYLDYLTKEEFQLITEQIDDFENYICFTLFDYIKTYNFWSTNTLEYIFLFIETGYFDLLAKSAEVGYKLCKKRLIELFFYAFNELGFIPLNYPIDKYFKYFESADIDQLIEIVRAKSKTKYSDNLKTKYFRMLLVYLVEIGNKKAAKILREKSISERVEYII